MIASPTGPEYDWIWVDDSEADDDGDDDNEE
jgi:hypothetical protein